LKILDWELNQRKLNIAVIGFGEAASAFVTGWAKEGSLSITGFDVKTDEAATESATQIWAAYESLGVNGKATLESALRDAEVVFSLVTADRAYDAAKEAAKFIGKEAYYLDCNSCSPGTKKKSSDIIERAGARYVDVAIMAPVYPKLHKTPLLTSGDHAENASAIFTRLQMDARRMDGGVGTSSSVKMVRSIMMKGLEALFAECVLAGRLSGVDKEVLASLEVTYPGIGFPEKSAYMFERMMQHGERRAAEMKEVAVTITELGLPADMADATVKWQQRIGELELSSDENDYEKRADILLKALGKWSE
jgi:3-hydroxyisobutyrate dehydrogenase-like beta-hydroxyacid dehydrogenase